MMPFPCHSTDKKMNKSGPCHCNCSGLNSGEDTDFLTSFCRKQEEGLEVRYWNKDTPDTPGSPEGNTEGPGTASSEPLLPS